MVALNRPPPPEDSAGTSSNGRRRAASVPPCAWAGMAASTSISTEPRSTTILALLISHLLNGWKLERDLKQGQYSRSTLEVGHLLAQEPQGEVDRPAVGAEGQGGHAQGEAAVEQGGGQEDPAVSPQGVDDLLIEPVGPFAAHAGRGPAEGGDR